MQLLQLYIKQNVYHSIITQMILFSKKFSRINSNSLLSPIKVLSYNIIT